MIALYKNGRHANMIHSELWDKVNQRQTAITDLLFKPTSEQSLLYFKFVGSPT